MRGQRFQTFLFLLFDCFVAQLGYLVVQWADWRGLVSQERPVCCGCCCCIPLFKNDGDMIDDIVI